MSSALTSHRRMTYGCYRRHQFINKYWHPASQNGPATTLRWASFSSTVHALRFTFTRRGTTIIWCSVRHPSQLGFQVQGKRRPIQAELTSPISLRSTQGNPITCITSGSFFKRSCIHEMSGKIYLLDKHINTEKNHHVQSKVGYSCPLSRNASLSITHLGHVFPFQLCLQL